MESLWQDLRYGVRMMIKTPAFTSIVVISLALGIGANTALFSVVDALLLKMLPVKEPERLVLFRSVGPRGFSPGNYSGGSTTDRTTGQRTMTSFAYQSFRRLREQSSDLSDVFAFGSVGLTASADGRAEEVSAQAVSGNYYSGLGVRPLLGRTLTEEDDHPAANPAAVLSYRYWQQRFGDDRTVIGKQINLNHIPFTVIGVTPPGFEGAMNIGSSQDVTIPISWEPQIYTDTRRSRLYGAGLWWLRIMGRLKPGASAEAARIHLENAFHQSVIEHRTARQAQALTNGGNPISDLDPQQCPRLYLDPGGQGEMGSRRYYAPSLYVLLGVVGLVLLIACANVANLLLARASARQKEVSVRLALGASRGRLIRQLLTESILLACASGMIGIVFALWFKNGLMAVSDWGGHGMRALDPRLDWRVLGFTLAISLLTGLLFGLAPAWRATRVDLTPALKDQGRGSGTASRSVLGRGLVVLQVGLSLLLLVGAGLFQRTLVNLQRVEPGFNTRNLLLFGITPTFIGYRGEKLAQLYQQIAERLEALPGVKKVTFSTHPLLSNSASSRQIFLPDALTAAPDSEGQMKGSGYSYINQVRDNFLEAMEIPLMAGRSFRPEDDARAPRVVVVNQTFARRFFANENPIGKRFALDPKAPSDVEIVGVAKDTKYESQRSEIPPTIYVPWRQELGAMTAVTVQIRTAIESTAIIDAVRQAVQQVEPNLPLNNIRTQSEQNDQTLAMERLLAKLVTFFGVLAQLLAAIGLFGVLAYSVSQRMRELGFRVALGATRRDIRKLVLRQGMALALSGVGLGLAATFGLTRYLESRINLSRMLYGVKLYDPPTYLVMALLLTLAALIACYIPARRASNADPMVALRHE